MTIGGASTAGSIASSVGRGPGGAALVPKSRMAGSGGGSADGSVRARCGSAGAGIGADAASDGPGARAAGAKADAPDGSLCAACSAAGRAGASNGAVGRSSVSSIALLAEPLLARQRLGQQGRERRRVQQRRADHGQPRHAMEAPGRDVVRFVDHWQTSSGRRWV